MDINTLGIGAIMGATLVAGVNLYIFNSNRKKDEIKERIDNLYSPLYVYYLENMKYISGKSHYDLYKDFLALKRIYTSNSIYSSDILKELFEEIIYKESDLMNLPEEERTQPMYYKLKFRDDKGVDSDFKHIMYRIEGWIDREHDELQIYYSKGIVGRLLWRLEIQNNPEYARGSIPAGRSF